MTFDEEELEILRQFHDPLAGGAVCTRATDVRLAALAPRVPKALLELWRSVGWCSYMNGLLRIVDPDTLEDVKKDWRLPADSIVIGSSGFGDLLAVTQGKLTIVFVQTGRFQVSSDSYSESLSALNEDDIDGLFFGGLYREAVEVHGAPTSSEMFTFEPALALGGEDNLEHVRRVQMKPALAILSQVHDKLISY